MPTRPFARGLVAVSAAAVLAASLAGCSLLNSVTGNVTRDDNGQVTEGNDNADVFSIKVGDCLNDATVTDEEVQSLPIVACTEPHDTEVVKSIQVDDGDFPGTDTLTAQAEEDCVAAFEEYVAFSYEDSVYDYGYYYPTAESWAGGDREILCTVWDPEGQITGTLEAAGK